MTKVAVQEYHRRMEEIRQLWSSMREAVSVPLVVSLDYCFVPVKMQVGSPTTCRRPDLDHNESLSANWDAIIKKIESQPKHLAVIYANIPEGESTTCLMQMVHIPKAPTVRPSPEEGAVCYHERWGC
jgi:hypothetical protein